MEQILTPRKPGRAEAFVCLYYNHGKLKGMNETMNQIAAGSVVFRIY